MSGVGEGMSGQYIDLDRCRKAMAQLVVRGLPTTPQRRDLIAAAIEQIQRSPETALAREYLGIKNYAGFGDQREDHEYGSGPRHGSIVFFIGRSDHPRSDALGEDQIYLLECVRDFGSVETPWDRSDYGAREPRRLNLCEAIQEYNTLLERIGHFARRFDAARVETHEIAR